MPRPVIYHIPVCPFSQRIEILLRLKGIEGAVDFHVVDVTRPRPDWLLEKSRGTTALPILETADGRVLKESLVLLRYIDETYRTDENYNDIQIARSDPYQRAVERLMITREGPFAETGYGFVMNRDRAETDGYRERMLEHYRWLGAFLEHHNPGGTYLFERYGLAELVFTSLMMRFWFLGYYEGFDLPDAADYARVRKWRAACLARPEAQQVSYEQIIKLYYDYAVRSGNGALPEGRKVSSFTFEPDWRDRPMPPKDKYDRIASDAELGLT